MKDDLVKLLREIYKMPPSHQSRLIDMRIIDAIEKSPVARVIQEVWEEQGRPDTCLLCGGRIQSWGVLEAGGAWCVRCRFTYWEK